MFVNQGESVEEVLVQGLSLLTKHGQRANSRNGPVLVCDRPVMTVTTCPRYRVLLSPWRDANPFFHLLEAAWMLAGRDDAAPLQAVVSRFAEYADNGYIHGAYGKRWRRNFGLDQLNEIVRRLQINPDDRQCVLQMWNCDVDSNKDLTAQVHDRPCNTHAYVRVRPASNKQTSQYSVLDLTVCCRSNDAVWGAHGANAVHFSYLQEYLADRLGVGVGVLYQLSNNYHLYESELARLQARGWQPNALPSLHYQQRGRTPRPLRMPWEPELDTDLHNLWRLIDGKFMMGVDDLGTTFCRDVWRAVLAHRAYRIGDYDAADTHVSLMEATDWRLACVEWLQRRRQAAQTKEAASAE